MCKASSRSYSSVGLNPVQELYNASEPIRVARFTAGGSHEGGDAVGHAILVQGAARVSLRRKDKKVTAMDK